MGDDLSSLPTITASGTPPAPGLTVVMANTGVGTLYRFPAAATVTAFRVRVGSTGGGPAPALLFKILRPTATANEYTVINTTLSQATAPFDQVTEVGSLSMPVQAGDTFGINFVGESKFAIIDGSAGAGVQNPGLLLNPIKGQTFTFGAPNAGMRLAAQAVYELPAPPPGTDRPPRRVRFGAPTNGKSVKLLRSLRGNVESDATKVELAVQQTASGNSASAAKKKKKKKKCRNLTATSGKLSKPGACSLSKLKYLQAALASGKWSLDLSKRLPPGRYKAFVRATDAAGNAGTASIAFKVKSRAGKKK